MAKRNSPESHCNKPAALGAGEVVAGRAGASTCRKELLARSSSRGESLRRGPSLRDGPALGITTRRLRRTNARLTGCRRPPLITVLVAAFFACTLLPRLCVASERPPPLARVSVSRYLPRGARLVKKRAAELDGDAAAEVVLAYEFPSAADPYWEGYYRPGFLLVLDWNGTRYLPTFRSGFDEIANMDLLDFDADGRDELVFRGDEVDGWWLDFVDFHGGRYRRLERLKNSYLWAWPPVLADLDGNGTMELVVDMCSFVPSDRPGYLEAVWPGASFPRGGDVVFYYWSGDEYDWCFPGLGTVASWAKQAASGDDEAQRLIALELLRRLPLGLGAASVERRQESRPASTQPQADGLLDVSADDVPSLLQTVTRRSKQRPDWEATRSLAALADESVTPELLRAAYSLATRERRGAARWVIARIRARRYWAQRLGLATVSGTLAREK